MKYTLYKKVCVLVIIAVHILEIICEKDIRNETEGQSDEKLTNKTKRGVFYVGRGLPSNYASIYSYGYQTPLFATPFVKPFGAVHTPYVIRPGGAAVTSYNVNYLRHPYYSSFNPFSTLLNPIIPSSHIMPAISPIIPAAPVVPANPPLIPTSSIIPANPSIIQTNPVVPAAPVVPANPPLIPSNIFIPSSSTIPAASAPVPASVPTFFIPHRPFTPIPVSPHRPIHQFPSVIPIHPGPTVPTTVIPANANHPSHPHGQPWRPVHNTPSASIPPTTIHGVHRPPISLLPPYEGTSHRANLEDFQTSPSREYLTPLQRQQQIAVIQSQRLLDEQQAQIANQVESLAEQGSYFGVSSYDVPLHGNKGYNY